MKNSLATNYSYYEDMPERKRRYVPPEHFEKIGLTDLFAYCDRSVGEKQATLFPKADETEPLISYAGNLALLKRPCVSVIGARNVSEQGASRARRVGRLLAEAGVVVTSGLARGVDFEAHSGALDSGGNTIAVIGTPLDRVYPAEHAELQEEIYRNHLLVSQFRNGQKTFPSDFPKRNRLMAALTDASIIVEASDSSGTLHQAAECVRLNRWLFIMKSVLDDQDLEWPYTFLKEPKVSVLSSIDDVLVALGRQ